MPLVLALAVLVCIWGIWDYFRSERPSITALVYSAVGLAAIGFWLVWSLAT